MLSRCSRFLGAPSRPASVAIVHGLAWSPSLLALGIRAGDLDHEAVGIVEVDPMPLPAVLDPGRVELADDLVGVEILDGVSVVAQAGVIIPEQGEEAVVVAPAQDPEEIPLLMDDLEAEVGPVELGGPLQVADVQGDVIQTLRLEGWFPVLAGAGGAGTTAIAAPRPISRATSWRRESWPFSNCSTIWSANSGCMVLTP